MIRPFLLALVALQAAPQAPPPDTDIFLAPLTRAGAELTVGTPINITRSPGYDNQPAFTRDGRGIYFTSIRGGEAATDIYRYDIDAATTTRVTRTVEGEYSATITPDGAHLSVIRVERDGTQRLWQFTLDGGDPQLVLRDVAPVGYHAWADAHTLALFVLGQPATLQVADTTTGMAEVVARDIGRSIQGIPGGGTLSVVVREPVEGGQPRLSIRELDVRTRALTPLVAAPAGASEADCAWTPDATLLVTHDDKLYRWTRGATGWSLVADLAALGLHGASRLAVSPDGTRLAIVARP